MKKLKLIKIFFLSVMLNVIISCQKIKEEVEQFSVETQQKVKDKTNTLVDEKVADIIKSVNIAEDVSFSDIFVGEGMKSLDSVKGKKIKLPNQSTAVVFKYKADKESLLHFLETQPTEDESQADKKAKKVDGSSLISKIKMAKMFLPQNLQENPILKNLETDKTLEFYRLNRLPMKSTFIYNPKDSTFLHLVELRINKK